MTATATATQELRRYRVKTSIHYQPGKDGQDVAYGPGCEAGDVVESRVDLVAEFGAEKFERLHEMPPRQSVAATLATGAKALNLDVLSLEQLQALAAEEEIDLRGAKTADDARKAIRAAIR